MAQDIFPNSHTRHSTSAEEWARVEQTLAMLVADCPIKPPILWLVYQGCSVGHRIAELMPKNEYTKALIQDSLRDGLGALRSTLQDPAVTANMIVFLLPQAEVMIAADRLVKQYTGMYWDRRNSLPFGGVVLIDTALRTCGCKGAR